MRCGEGRMGGDWVPRVFTAGTRTTETSDADMGVLRPRTTGPTRNGSHQSWTYSVKHEVKKAFTHRTVLVKRGRQKMTVSLDRKNQDDFEREMGGKRRVS